MDRTEYFDCLEDVFTAIDTLPDANNVRREIADKLLQNGKITKSEHETIMEWNCFDL